MAEDSTTVTPDTAESVQADAETSTTRVESAAQLTQDDVDRVVESRLARERRKFEGYDEYKAKAEAYDEAVAANQTELEQAINRASQLEEQVADLAGANQYIVARNGLLQEIAKPDYGIVDPEGAIEFLLGIDSEFVEFDEDGSPLNAEKAVQDLISKRSYLVSSGTAQRSDADQGARGGQQVDQLTEADLQTMTPLEIVKARNEGRLDDVLTGKS